MPFLFLVSFLFAAPKVDSEWLKLLHYEKNIFGNYVSRSTGDEFFTSKDHSPQAELDSFLQAYDQVTIDNEHVICKFPLRTKYILKKGYRQARKNTGCPLLDTFRANLSPVGVSLIFSSYFLESPASTFGHTFLRLRKNPPKVASEKQIELLDHGIGYAANPTTNNPILYTILGFTGGFDGTFSLVPYYYKVREYNDFESRDLWSYDLNLNQQEIEDLVDHIWEVGHGHFPYYYLTENCSYYMLEILEIVSGRKLLERIPFWVIPVDSIKAAVEEPGFVKEVSFRPSLKSQFDTRVKALNDRQQKEVQSLEYKDSWTTLQIDAAIDYLDLKYGKEIREEGSEKFILKDKLLQERAKRSESSVISVSLPPRPDRIHPSSRTSLGLGYQKEQKSYLSLEQRFAYYDALDFPIAKPPFSEIIFMDIAAKYYEESKDLKLENLDLVKVKIRNPRNLWFSPLSYSLGVGGKRETLLCETSSCFVFSTAFDVGFHYVAKEKHSLYIAMFADARASSKMERGFGVYVGPKIELTNYWFQQFRSMFTASYVDLIDRKQDAYWDLQLELRWDLQPDRFSLGVSQSLKDEVTESHVGLHYYY